MQKIDPRINPSIRNYFIGDQYKCQQTCITKNFWTADRIIAENDNGSKPVLEWAKNIIDTTKPISILDIGCGPSQKIFKLFGQNSNIRVTGLDSEEATKLAKKFNPSGTYHPCDLDCDNSINTVSKQIGFFDVIFCLDVIEHVLYPEKMINLIKDHATVKTQIFITTLERDLSMNAGNLMIGSKKQEHVREWNHTEFLTFLSFMNLKILKFKITPMKFSQHCQTFLCAI